MGRRAANRPFSPLTNQSRTSTRVRSPGADGRRLGDAASAKLQVLALIGMAVLLLPWIGNGAAAHRRGHRQNAVDFHPAATLRSAGPARCASRSLKLLEQRDGKASLPQTALDGRLLSIQRQDGQLDPTFGQQWLGRPARRPPHRGRSGI